MASGDRINVGNAYVTIIPSLEGAQQSISEQLGASAGAAAKSVGEQSGQDFGNALATGIKATAAVVAAATAAVAGAAIATGKAFIQAANDVSEWGNTVDKESQKMNMTAEGYQTWAFILEHAGASIDGMKNAMKKLTIAAEEGNDAFAALGISEEQLAAMSPEETWNATIEALQNVADEGERTALANELLGKGAVELAPLFNMTAEETDELKTQVKELGGIMSDDAVKAAAEYQDELQNMNVALDGVKNNMMSEFLPGMSQVMKGLSMVFSGQGGIEEIKAGLGEITANIVELSPEFFEIASAIATSILEGFGAMLPAASEALFGFINDALVTVTGLIPSLLPVITSGLTALMSTVLDCLPLITSSLLTLVTDLVTWLASGNNVKLLVDGIVNLVGAVVSQIGLVLPVLLPAVVSIIGDVAKCLTTPDNLAILLNAVLLCVGAVIQALVNVVPEFIDYYVGLVTNIADVIIGFTNWVEPYFSQGLNYVLGLFNSWGSSIKSFFSGIVSTITSTVSNWVGNIKATIVNFTIGVYNTVTGWIYNLQNGFINGFNSITSWVGNILGSIGQFVGDVVSTLSGLPGQIVSIGSDMAEGLINGLDVDWVVEQVKELGKKAIKALKETLGIASPSKEFEKIGYFSALGFGGGWSDEMDIIADDMVDGMTDLTGSMSAEVTAYGAGGAATIGDTTTYNGGAVTMNIYGAEGQDVNELADVIAERLGDMTARKGAVYA